MSADTAGPVLYRLFLRGGDTLVSYGDHARVGIDVVFSIPLSDDPTEGRTELVSVPADAIDWAATDSYAEAARAAHFAATRGEADFATLSTHVAAALHAIAVSTDAVQQLSIAEHTRRGLVDWSAAHHAYRLVDVRQIVAMLDETIAALGAGSGVGLAAAPVPLPSLPATRPLMPHPRLTEVIIQAMRVAELTRVPAERVSLFQAVVRMLETSGGALPDAWRDRTRSEALERMDTELDVGRAYSDLTGIMLARARAAAGRADVAAVVELVHVARVRDAQLGARRPNMVAALMAALEGVRTQAETLRVARAQWNQRVAAYRQRGSVLDETRRRFEQMRPALEAIRALTPSHDTELGGVEAHGLALNASLGAMSPPEGFEGVHSLLRRALQLSIRAATLRRRGPGATTSRGTRNAAAGAVMLFDLAGAELECQLAYPELP